MPVRRVILGAVVCACGLAIPIGAFAQVAHGDGFLFGAPTGTLTLRGGYTQPSANSDVFSFSDQHLTLGRGDYGGGYVSLETAYLLRDRLAVLWSVGYSKRSVGSEFRDWVDNNDRPIEQTTELRRIPIMMGLRYYLSPPGRSLGRLAWVPARVAPYLTAGVGTVWYKFMQTGDFVDYQTLDVFHSTLESNAWTLAGYGAAGLEYALNARVGLVGEARYDRAHAGMSSDFSGFDRIDLSGLSATVGLLVRF